MSWARPVRRHPRDQLPGRGTPVEAIAALTDGNGAEVTIDAVGNPEVFRSAFYARDHAGTVVHGRRPPRPDMTSNCRCWTSSAAAGSRSRAGTATACRAATSRCLISLFQQGRLPLDLFVSETIGLGDIEEAFDRMHAGRRPAQCRGVRIAEYPRQNAPHGEDNQYMRIIFTKVSG